MKTIPISIRVIAVAAMMVLIGVEIHVGMQQRKVLNDLRRISARYDVMIRESRERRMDRERRLQP